MAEIHINVTGENCPVPLVETRKAIKKAQPGDIIEITGSNQASKKEIPMAAAALKLKLLNIEETDGIWKIRIEK